MGEEKRHAVTTMPLPSTTAGTSNVGRKQANSLDKALATAYKAERITEVQYRARRVPIKSWLDAQATRRSASAAVTANRLERLTSHVALYQVRGGDASAVAAVHVGHPDSRSPGTLGQMERSGRSIHS